MVRKFLRNKDINVEKLSSVELKVDKMQEDVSEIKITLAVNTASLQQHMEQTKINREEVKLTQESLEILKTELKPIHDHVLKVNFIVTIMGAIGAVAAFLYTIVQIAEFIGRH